jgi:hypothetical protein
MSRKGVGVVSSVTANADVRAWTAVKNCSGVARANYHAKEDCELSFQQGDEFEVIAKTNDWLRAKSKKTKVVGLCPISYVEVSDQSRLSHKDLLSELDHMFEETMTAADAERQEDEEALKAAAALEAEFSFDNIMAEVMAMKGDSPSAGKRVEVTLEISGLEMSLGGSRYSSEIEEGFNDDLPVPRKPLPPPPSYAFDGVGVDDEDVLASTPSPSLVAVSASPRGVRRNLSPPTIAGTTLSVNSVPPSGQRKSAAPPSPIPPPSKSVSSSPSVSRTPQHGRPIAKLLGEDGQMRCAKCSTVVGKDATFCKHCGATLKLAIAEQCLKCKLILKPGATSCGSCGTRTSESSHLTVSSPAISMKNPVSPRRTLTPSETNDTSTTTTTTTTTGTSTNNKPTLLSLSDKTSHPSTNSSSSASAFSKTPLSPRRSAANARAAAPDGSGEGKQTQPPPLVIGSPRRSTLTSRESSNKSPSAVKPDVVKIVEVKSDTDAENKTRIIVVNMFL